MMGTKVFYSGLALLLAGPVLLGSVVGLNVELLGALITAVGAVLIVIDR